ncbi:MAG: CDP-diacylglycerol--glycerol-3-phosphate 3-phosphatidyltransferase [Treponema sp.]|nr:CDP-diacylglycerol--glycerol-3-phosphate 3-phosphatidyltransferase [Treponema sp.]
MSLADKFTLLRIILAPVFFIVYLLPIFFPSWFPHGSGWTVPVFWLIAIVAELTDMFDGMAARKLNEVSDFGKFFDPFADTLFQITCFLCLVITGIFPVILFLVVIYREFSILLIRNLMLKMGVTMGARISGKVKTVTYIIAGAVALLATSVQRLEILEFLYPIIKNTAVVLFSISVIVAVVSFFDYLSAFKKASKIRGQSSN